MPREDSDRKPIIVGQAPARGRDEAPAFTSASGARLAKLAGVGTTGEDLQKYFETMNLTSRYGGKQGKGDRFDLAAARSTAGNLLEWLAGQEQSRTVLFMGRGVAKAFGFGKKQYLEPWVWKFHTLVVFPHPSGVNRWWNDPWNVHAAERMLGNLVRGKPIVFR
jgi:uracil-DNA glycosylase